MTILIINNYFIKDDFWKAQAIADRLKGFGRDDCKILHFSRISQEAIPLDLEAIILSGSTGDLSKEGDISKFEAEMDLVRDSNIPILGICFGHQLIARAFGSKIECDSWVKEFKKITIIDKDDIFTYWGNGQEVNLYQNHKEYVESVPVEFTNLAESETCKIEAIRHKSRPIYGVQAHIERANCANPDGLRILESFLSNVVNRTSTKQRTSQWNPEEFRKKVEESEHRYEITDCIYNKCIQEISNLSLDKLEKDHEIRIFRPFLLTWGTMTRVLGYEGVRAVCSEVQSLSRKIEPLRKKDLSAVNLFDLRDLIVDLFNRLSATEFKSKKNRLKKAGSTAPSKVLHLTCPRLFVMWDAAIREGFGKSKGDGKEYFEFLLIMQTVMLVLQTTINSLEEKYGKKPTRIIDQFNWMRTH